MSSLTDCKLTALNSQEIPFQEWDRIRHGPVHDQMRREAEEKLEMKRQKAAAGLHSVVSGDLGDPDPNRKPHTPKQGGPPCTAPLLVAGPPRGILHFRNLS